MPRTTLELVLLSPNFRTTPTEWRLTTTCDLARNGPHTVESDFETGILQPRSQAPLAVANLMVYNGLMARPDWKEVVKTPIGVIPGGSGNGLAKAINYAVGEPYDVTVVTPSVLNILKGRVAPWTCRVSTQGVLLLFSCLSGEDSWRTST
ncbi:hypothetical protein AVEN_3768-1 [Araneus ventricosus]|uniref:DAGKc domain-containing protein n=1 Tax=Araneus ventricosus TaxID=182803 RepID=A0A4Y2NNY9_ARAVE|nr:hypothetical protein AVEN_3768-1 [Araneus ventricosus]